LTSERLQAVGGKNWVDTLILWKLEGAVSGGFIDVGNFVGTLPCGGGLSLNEKKIIIIERTQ
jgi:hypothetical protein